MTRGSRIAPVGLTILRCTHVQKMDVASAPGPFTKRNHRNMDAELIINAEVQSIEVGSRGGSFLM